MLKFHDGVSRVHFGTFLLSSFWTISLIVFLNAMQPYLLTEVYGTETNELGKVTGTLGLLDEIVSVLFMGVWGAVSDLYGRRIVSVAGYLMCGVSLFLMPFGGNVYPGLLSIRLLFAGGAAALTAMLTSLLGDYVQGVSRGKAAGIMGLFSGLGAICSVFLFVGQLPQSLCTTGTYQVVGGVTLVVGIICFFCLNKQVADNEGMTNNVFKLIYVGFKLGVEDRRVALAYTAGFIARSTSVLLSAFITLWVAKAYTESDLCFDDGHDGVTNSTESACGLQYTNEVKRLCPAAFSTGSRISGTTQVAALLAAPVIGFLLDRNGSPASDVSNSRKLAALALLGVAGFAAVAGIDINKGVSPLLMILSLVWGTTQIGLVVLSQVLVTASMPDGLNGTVAGCFSVVGGFGVMTCNYLGGILFDKWREAAPFLLNAILCGLVFLVSVWFSFVGFNKDWDQKSVMPRKWSSEV